VLTFDDLDAWLEEIAELDGVRSAVLEPALLRTPGVWAQVPSFGVDTLAADQYRLDVLLHLAVGGGSDLRWREARDQLAELFATVHAHLGSPRAQTVEFIRLVLPAGEEVPALRFPYTLRIVPD
jgi:hypothetical protein